jgi:XTP/dITP diphosphohydrolase
VARHPHVFPAADGSVAVAGTPDAVVAQWERIKSVEKAHRSSVLDGIPQAMPALAVADKIVGRAAKVGVVPVVAPVPATEDELGQQLLGMVTAARAAGLDSERALRGALRRLQDDIRAAEQR